MPERETSCPYGADSDIDARYLAGSLSAEESEAFEQHYFACDRCFAAVERGNEIRAALASAAAVSASASGGEAIPTSRRSRRSSTWWPALAAAAVVLVAFGIRQAGTLRRSSSTGVVSTPGDAARGAGNRLNLTSHATSSVLIAAWPAQPTAQSYRVRLLATDGSLLFEREVADTSVMLSRDLLRGAGSNPVFWEVQALDALRSVVATSPVVQAQTSPSPP